MRQASEWVLRAVAIAAIAVILWRWFRPPAERAAVPEIVTVRGEASSSALRRWTGGATRAGHVSFDGTPDVRTRAWLRALARAGVRIGWSAGDAVPIAIAATPVVDPAGGVRMEVAAPNSARVVVGDALDMSDTVRAMGAGAAVTLPSSADTLLARSGPTVARIVSPAPATLGDVLVLGHAGWEAKFVAAALEERGWHVQVRLVVAPGIAVTAAGVAPDARPVADTSRLAAVVVLDSGAVDAATSAALARYVHSGGGLVLVGDAGAAPALRALAPGAKAGAPIPGVLGALDGRAPRRGLALLPIEDQRPDAVVLEREEVSPNAPVAVSARRVGSGRVVQVGYLETWRWRMAGSDEAPAAHRAWWARVVGGVARAPVSRIASADPLGTPSDPAPLAATIDALGPPSAAPNRSRAPSGRLPSDGLLATIAGAAVLAEVASRRLRGAG